MRAGIGAEIWRRAARQVRAQAKTSRGVRYFASDAVACRDIYRNEPKLAAAEDDPAPHPNAQSRDCETVGGLGGVAVVATTAAGGTEEAGVIGAALVADDANEEVMKDRVQLLVAPRAAAGRRGGDDIVLFTVACENVVCFESYSGLTTCVRLQCRVIGAPSPGRRRRLSRPCQCPARAFAKERKKKFFFGDTRFQKWLCPRSSLARAEGMAAEEASTRCQAFRRQPLGQTEGRLCVAWPVRCAAQSCVNCGSILCFL